MHRAVILLVFVAGCSTHPVADFMDYVFPPGGVRGQGRGGVCTPTPVLSAPPAGAPPGARLEGPPPPEPPAVPGS